MKSLLPVIFGVAALFLTAASLQAAVVPVELAPNPNPAGNLIETPFDWKPLPISPDVTSFVNGTFTNYGEVIFYGSFDNNGTVDNYGRSGDYGPLLADLEKALKEGRMVTEGLD